MAQLQKMCIRNLKHVRNVRNYEFYYLLSISTFKETTALNVFFFFPQNDYISQ